MAYKKDWFENNMYAELAPGMGGCSFCCFRNLDKGLFCSKLTCYDERTDNFVYWTSKYAGDMLRGVPPVEMVEWFNKTSDTEHVSANMIRIGRQR